MESSQSVFMYLLFFYVNVSLFIKTIHCQGKQFFLPENRIAILFTFGDSVFDDGNNNYINTTTTLQANYPPYGESFFKYPTGRFSDGLVIPDYIRWFANLPLGLPYLHPPIFQHRFIFGSNFASAGAGALNETNRGLAINLLTQASYFSQVSQLLREDLGDEKGKELISKAVYIFSVGGNDYLVPFLTNSSVVLPYPPQEFVDYVIGNISLVLREIYNEGGRKFGIINVYPLNCFPILRIRTNGSTISECLQGEASELARLHNSALPIMLQNLQKELPGFDYSLTDLYSALVQLMTNPSNYGFVEGNVACCGGGPYRGDNSCGGKRGIPEYELCENVTEYVFFDSIHATQRVDQYFAELMWDGDGNFTQPHNLKTLFQV